MNILEFYRVRIPEREYKRRNNEESKPLRSPTIAGGIFSIYKDYFVELGTYDEDMLIWGGDNLDLSFRVRFFFFTIFSRTLINLLSKYKKKNIKNIRPQRLHLYIPLYRCISVWYSKATQITVYYCKEITL